MKDINEKLINIGFKNIDGLYYWTYSLSKYKNKKPTDIIMENIYNNLAITFKTTRDTVERRNALLLR